MAQIFEFGGVAQMVERLLCAEGTGIDTLLLHFLFRRLVRAVRTPQNAFFYV